MRREILWGLEIAALVGIATTAFTKSQREWIVERDENKCQAPFPHVEDTEHPKQVHHIIPQRYCLDVGIPNPDFPENGILLCRNSHEIIHPDVPEARKKYYQDHSTFKRMEETREQKLKNRQTYWNTTWDRLMGVVAVRNTQSFERKSDREFPVQTPTQPPKTVK